MTCERRFRDDAYRRSCAAHVVAVSERGLEPDRTAWGTFEASDPGKPRL
jgi:Ser-tRNA(Ala) deacylase AlaX